MAMTLQHIAFLALALGSATVQAATGQTTRYWDCCKPSCGWDGKASVSHPVTSCDKNDNPLSGYEDVSGCDSSGGTAYMCSSQTPWSVNDTLALGFAAVKLAGGTESSWCCACYKLTFTSGPVSGKQMIVQATNTGSDLGDNHFDLAMPGGGVGIFNGCTAEWGAPSSGWGAQYGGISSRSECDAFPAALQPGCDWRFDWFEGADNPTVEFEQVTCPSELTAKTGCIRNGETPTPIGSAGTATATATGTGTATSSAVGGRSSSPAAGSGSTGGTVGQWAQCGGIGYTGSTVCQSGYTCVVINDYYSQCQ